MEGAIRSGNLDRVQELIQGGVDVNSCCKGTPLLSLAIKLDRTEIALELIDHGASVHSKDAARGRTALHWACKDESRKEVVQRLLDKGSSVNEEDGQGRTPLLLAARWGGKRGVTNCLLRAGASCQALSTRQKNLLVRYACLEGDVFTVENLIANECDVNTTYVKGNTLLMQAVEEGHEELVKMLILAGAKIDLQDLEGSTALHYAALNDHIQCGILLTEGGANIGIKDKHSRTALSVARSEEFKEAIKQAHSFTLSKILCIVGNSGVGKSTLIAALQAERNSFFGKTFNRIWRVADHRKRTAGIETVHHSSQRYGEALFFDFAGQHEYYGPHQTYLESILSKPGVSMTLLLVVKATDQEETIIDQLYYWLFPVAQMATTVASHPHVIIIGSFLDHVKSKDEATAKLLRCIEETKKGLNDILQMTFAGYCVLNCRQPQSKGIERLCHFLREIPTPKLKAIHTHYSLAWVLSQFRLAFKDQLAVQLHTLAKWMQENRGNLPPTIPSPVEVCKDLSATGQTLYLPNKDHCHNGWLVLNLAGILHDVYGTLFSRPKESINKFGLLSCRELAQLFPQMHADMVRQLLTTLEFCTPVDLAVLSKDVTKLTAGREINDWLFFPAFVSVDPPKVALEGYHWPRICSLWWQLKTSGKQFFFAQVLQTILLHLAAHFAVRHDRADGVQQHCCNFWWNGISWQSKEGVDVTVHITNRAINVVGISQETADKLHQYLREVITDIMSTVHQVSPHLKADAYIVHRPVRMTMSCDELVTPSCKELFPVADIESSIKDCKKYSLSLRDDGDTWSSRVAVSDLFKGAIPTLEDIKSFCWTQHDPIQSLAEVSSVNDPQLQTDPAYHTTCCSMDITLISSVIDSLPLAAAESLQPLSMPAFLDVSSKPTANDIGKLVVTPVAAKWQIMAIWLEVDGCVIDIISKNHPNNCEGACWDMLNRWLRGEHYTGEKQRTWSTLLTALGRAGYIDLEQGLRRKYFKTV